jgi:hypothetical protein
MIYSKTMSILTPNFNRSGGTKSGKLRGMDEEQLRLKVEPALWLFVMVEGLTGGPG